MRPRRIAVALLAGCGLGLLWTALLPQTLAGSLSVRQELEPPAGELSPPAREPLQLTTVVLVRHAEKGSDDPRDPALSEAGVRRAQALARLLARSSATHLYASEYRRTQQTLAPLADALELEVEVRPARDSAALTRELQALMPGSVAVVAGHSNTVPQLAAALGAPIEGLVESRHGPMLAEREYDRLFLLQFVRDSSELAPRILELRYGED